MLLLTYLEVAFKEVNTQFLDAGRGNQFIGGKLPQAIVLGQGKRLQCAIERASALCIQTLLEQESQVVQPNDGHFVHIVQ